MINWDEELEKIFNDPLLADVKVPIRKVSSSDRLIAGFQQILDFVEKNNRLPENCTESNERILYFQLKGILKDPSKKERCLPYDTHGILGNSSGNVANEKEISYAVKEKTESEQLDEIFNDPIFSNIETSENCIFDLPDYMKKRLKEREEADYIAKRVKCEDFELYENGFKEIHYGLKSGKYKLIKFKDAHISEGRYFVDNGIFVYIASLNKIQKNKHGRKDTRTRCIYENGLESDIYMQSLCKSLYNTGYSVQNVSLIEESYLKDKFKVNENDVESGIIYVLRSLSKNPEISSIRNLYKIGFTTTSLVSRIANAKNEPTYLCADVEVVATWRIYNVKTSVLESFIHRLFSNVQLQVKIDGKRANEWFIVPFNIIEKAIMSIMEGKSIEYDKDLQQIIEI